MCVLEFAAAGCLHSGLLKNGSVILNYVPSITMKHKFATYLDNDSPTNQLTGVIEISQSEHSPHPVHPSRPSILPGYQLIAHIVPFAQYFPNNY